MKKVLDNLRIIVGVKLISVGLCFMPSGHSVTIALARGVSIGLRGRS